MRQILVPAVVRANVELANARDSKPNFLIQSPLHAVTARTGRFRNVAD
jgi:hypothetical protein